MGNSKWLMESNVKGEIALLCIPYAGASAGMYGKWNQKLGADIKVSALLLPFRDARRKEELPVSVQALAEEFVLENKEFFEKPYVIYGHCTGAILGYEIERSAQRIYGKNAIAMIVSNAQEPNLIPQEAEYLSRATEEEIEMYLLYEKLVEPEMLEVEEFRDYYFPILQADFKLYSEYRCEKERLCCPIWAFYDEKDPRIQEELVHSWEDYTDEFHAVKVPGGHFSFQNNEEQLLCEIRKVCGNKKREENSLLGKELLESMKTHGEKIALIYQEKEYSYADLLQKIYKCQALYWIRGLRKGDRIAIKLENHPEFVITFLAAVSLGIVPILLLPAQGKNESIGVIKAARPKLFLCEEKGEESDTVEKECEILYGIIEREKLTNLLETIKMEEKIEKTMFSSDEIALLLLSGGTTGIPKLIPRTQGDYLYNIKKISERLKINSESIYLSVLPMAHNFGLANPGILGTLLHGGTVVICEDVAPLEIFGMIEQYHVTYTAFVPSVLKMCVDYRKEDDDESLESLQFILSGGAMLPEDLAREADKYLEAKLIQVFGTAEGLICTNELRDSLDIRITSQGKPISELDEIRIVGDDEKIVGAGIEGELRARGPYTIHGYLGLENNADYFDADGFYCTGDKAYLSEEGNLYIVGRIKEQINRSGEKIMPAELEEIIMRHSEVRDCAVIGKEDEVLGQRICAFIICEEEVGVEEIRNFLSEQGLALFKLPDELHRVERFPYTAVGKVDKKQLAQM